MKNQSDFSRARFNGIQMQFLIKMLLLLHALFLLHQQNLNMGSSPYLGKTVLGQFIGIELMDNLCTQNSNGKEGMVLDNDINKLKLCIQI